MSGDLVGQLLELHRRVAELERRARGRKRTGTVSEVDHAKGLARVKLSEQEGKDFVSPWLPWKEVAAGGIKSHIPPTVGEQVDVTSESGDLADAVIDMSTPSSSNPRPHDGPEAVITKGSCRIEIGDDTVSIAAGKVKITADVTIEGALAVNGGGVTNDGVNIGKDHIHTGVIAGGDVSGPPA